MDIRRFFRRILGRAKDNRAHFQSTRPVLYIDDDNIPNNRPEDNNKAVAVSPSLFRESADRPNSLPPSPFSKAATNDTSDSLSGSILSNSIYESTPDSINDSIHDKQSTAITGLEDITLTPPSQDSPAVPPEVSGLASSEDNLPQEACSSKELASSEQPAVVVLQPTPSPQNENTPPALSELSTNKTVANSSVVSVASSSISSFSLPSSSDSIPSIAQVVQQEQEPRRQSLVSISNEPELLKILTPPGQSARNQLSLLQNIPEQTTHLEGLAAMLTRKIWVKRPGSSPTLVTIREDDLVDDARDKILMKYANSLGRTYDSPDVTLRIASRSEAPRAQVQERLLGPEEDLCRVLDSYYPGGQTVAEALLIDIPPKKTPRPSPRHQHNNSNGHNNYHALEEFRPHESGTDYFPPMPAVAPPAITHAATFHDPRTGHAQVLQLPEHARSISVLQTGQVPPLPSPGAATRRHRPKYPRQHTASPTTLPHPTNPAVVAALKSPNPIVQQIPHRSSMQQRPRHDSNTSERPNGIPMPPPLPTPPAPEAAPTAKNSSTPPTPVPRDHHRVPRPRKLRKVTPTNGSTTGKPSALTSLLDGSVPPINVLIVEDNIINLKLLEAFMKRLKVRWSTAMNGQIAVDKWRAGGFHLVLMDIQLPIMSGLDATKEIRRLERVNGIGVFSNSQPGTPSKGISTLGRDDTDGSEGTVVVGEQSEKEKEDERRRQEREKDRLVTNEGLFKSPVIIVALTASSLQSDRHEALAAGCNDFLTKPVNFVWLERKVKEWGCMQALIDFDGWRKWKDFSSDDVAGDKRGLLLKNLPAGAGIDAGAALDQSVAAKAKEKKKQLAKDKRASMEVAAAAGTGAGTIAQTSGPGPVARVAEAEA